MLIDSFLSPSSTIVDLKVNSKKQLFQELSEHIARASNIEARTIYETLLQRERLGTTGIGYGIAVPHGRVAGLNKLVGFFARLSKPLEFDSLDGVPVDLLFVLLAPEESGADHLQALAKIARLFRDPVLAQRLRHTEDVSALYALLTTSNVSSRAA